MRRSAMALIAAAVVALPGTILAQSDHPRSGEDQSPSGMMGAGQGHAMMGSGMMGGMSAGPSIILRQKEALKLSDSQITQLEAIQQELAEAREAYAERIRPLRSQAREALKGDDPDLSKYESALKKMAEEQVNVRVKSARAGQRAMQVLDAEQLSDLRYGKRLMSGRMGGGGCSMMGSNKGDDGGNN